ncbi:MAG: MFS transporter, partial [Thermomicrobia bacterium]|nr:MFS transporter [Thermomicrobia bacterium]
MRYRILMSSDEFSSTAPPLRRNRDYLLLLGGQGISVLGGGLSGIALPLLVLALTHSPAQAGFVEAVFGLPYLFFSLPAGALVDRWDRKKTMIVCDSVRAVNAATVPLAAALGHLTMEQIYVNAAVEGTLFVFFNVAEVAALPQVVTTEQIPEASSQNQAVMFSTSLVSPPLGGFIFQVLGRTVPFLFDAVSYFASVISLMLISRKFQTERTVERRRLMVEIGEGLAWLRGQPLILFMTFLTAGLNFAGNAVFLIIIIIAKHQHASPTAIGGMVAVGGVGGLLGSLVAPRLQKRFGYGQVIIVSVALQAVVFPFFAVAPNPLVLGLLFAGIALLGPIYNAVQFSYRLSLIPDELQGRVNSVVRMIAFGAVPL